MKSPAPDLCFICAPVGACLTPAECFPGRPAPEPAQLELTFDQPTNGSPVTRHPT